MWGRHRETKCKCVQVYYCSLCVCHFIIRNVIKISEGLCAFYYVFVIIVCAHVCVCIDEAERSRYDLLRWHYLPLICLCFIFCLTGSTVPTIALYCSVFKDKQLLNGPSWKRWNCCVFLVNASNQAWKFKPDPQRMAKQRCLCSNSAQNTNNSRARTKLRPQNVN